MISKAGPLIAYVVRTWLFWMSGAFSLLLTVFVLFRAASGSPASPNNTLVIFGCLTVIAFVISGVTAWRHERLRVTELQARLDGRDRDASKLRVLRDNLAATMLEGQQLQGRLASTDEPLEALEPEIHAWATNTEAWLAMNLGRTYVVRFRNGAGISVGTFVMRRALNTKEGPLNGFMRVRLASLDEFIAELN